MWNYKSDYFIERFRDLYASNVGGNTEARADLDAMMKVHTIKVLESILAAMTNTAQEKG